MALTTLQPWRRAARTLVQRFPESSDDTVRAVTSWSGMSTYRTICGQRTCSLFLGRAPIAGCFPATTTTRLAPQLWQYQPAARESSFAVRQKTICSGEMCGRKHQPNAKLPDASQVSCSRRSGDRTLAIWSPRSRSLSGTPSVERSCPPMIHSVRTAHELRLQSR